MILDSFRLDEPGGVETKASILGPFAAGRWRTPEAFKGVVFLASAASHDMNGAILPVDSGWLAS